MKKHPIVIALVTATFMVALLINTFFARSTTSQMSNAEIVVQARQNYAFIEGNLENYTQTESRISPRIAVHGGQVIVWSQNAAPRKMEVRYGMTYPHTQYYFQNSHLFLVVQGSNRFHFSRDKLAFLVDRNGRIRSTDMQLLRNEETQKLRDARRFLSQTIKAQTR